jgi:GNAT superfamily N-acetyltransferase
MHPLLNLMLSATVGRFPPIDGGVTVVPPLERGWECSVAFTGHAVIATARSFDAVVQHGADGFGGSLAPDFLRWLAGANGVVGVTDVMLWAPGTGGSTLGLRTDRNDHPRVHHALERRSGVAVHGDERGFVTLSNGLGGRREMSVEAEPAGQGRGWGRSLIIDALGLVPPGGPVFAAVSPGNARSLRAFLACGFTPIGSEVLVRPIRESVTDPQS